MQHRARNNYEMRNPPLANIHRVDVAILIIEKVSMDLKILIRVGTDGVALVSLDDLAISFLYFRFLMIFPDVHRTWP